MLAIILLTLATGVSGVDGTSLQFTNLEIRAEQCDADGKLYFTAENKYLKPLLLKDLMIEGWHEDKGKKEDQENIKEKIKFYPTAGTYSREEIYAESTNTKKSTFVSERGLLNQSGRYLFNVSYSGCKNLPCTEHFDVIDCPGYQYSCDVQEQQVKITGCTENDDIFQIFFEGFNDQQYQKVAIENEVLIYVETNGRQELRKTVIVGKEIVPQVGKNDAYVYRFPLAENETVVRAGISALQCDKGLGPGSQVFWCSAQQLAQANQTQREATPTVLPKEVKKETKKKKEKIKQQETEITETAQQTPSPQISEPPLSAPLKGTAEKETFFTPMVVMVLAGVWVVLVMVAIIVFAVVYKKH